MKEFKTYVKDECVKLKPFPGTTMKQQQHYTIPSFVDKTPSIVIIYGRLNDIYNWNATAEQISTGIADKVVVCYADEVNAVFVFTLPLICIKNNYLNGKVPTINFFLVISAKKCFDR